MLIVCIYTSAVLKDKIAGKTKTSVALWLL